MARTSNRRSGPLSTDNTAQSGKEGKVAPPTLFDALLQVRDAQRASMQDAEWLIRGDDLPWEVNAHGKMKWFLHPSLEGLALRNLLLYVQEIPPGSRSGRQKCQGGVLFYVLQGQGYTLLDRSKHPWKAEDVINLPIREEGIEYQHVNTDPDQPALLVACEPNFVDILGVDKGSGFEEIEPAPEYVTAQDTHSSDASSDKSESKGGPP